MTSQKRGNPRKCGESCVHPTMNGQMNHTPWCRVTGYDCLPKACPKVTGVVAAKAEVTKIIGRYVASRAVS